jgi:hypothetical protein
LICFCPTPSEYLNAKQEVDQLRQRQNELRSERDVSIPSDLLYQVCYLGPIALANFALIFSAISPSDRCE